MADGQTRSFKEKAKTAVKSLVPPILLPLYRRITNPNSGITDVEFKQAWKKARRTTSATQMPDLVGMVDAFIESPSFATTSKYWHYLNRKTLQELLEFGYERFKQTAATSYLTFVGAFHPQYSGKLLEHALEVDLKVPLGEIFRPCSQLSREQSAIYHLLTLLLYDHLLKQGGAEHIKRLEEPLEGSPPYIVIDGKRITQDLLNSVLDFRAVARGVEPERITRMLEIGAGSGRTAYAFARLLPNLRKYVIVDVPPALYLSQTYLSHSFPEKKLFKFRPFTSFSAVAEEFEAAELAFLMPHQLALLPDRSVDVFLAINCLHEMTPDLLESYFEQMNRLADFLYYKCWLNTTIPYDQVQLTADAYPVRPHWKKTYLEDCVVPATFFHAFYDLRPAS